jgi:phosphoribulokinase
MKQLLILGLLTIINSVHSQEVVSTQGETYSSPNAIIDFTVGEVVINTVSDGTNNITQGFHQTNWNFVGLENHTPSFEAIIFPNPTLEVLNIRASAFENVTYTLYDAQGKLIVKDKLTAEQTLIPVSQLATGSYSITLNNPTAKFKDIQTYKNPII